MAGSCFIVICIIVITWPGVAAHRELRDAVGVERHLKIT